MEKKFIATGKDFASAVQAALKELGLEIEQVDVYKRQGAHCSTRASHRRNFARSSGKSICTDRLLHK